MLNGHHRQRESGQRPIYVEITSNTNNVNLYTLAGNPGSAVVCICTIAAGVIVGTSSQATPSLRTGSFIAGSTVKVIVNGKILGWPGYGGDGGAGNLTDGYPGVAGTSGGDSVWLDVDATFDVTTGLVGAGGGGGGGGGGKRLIGFAGWGGGGGGGAQGCGVGHKGNGGIGSTANGTNGTDGSATSNGYGGAPGDWPTTPAPAGWGGDGGGLGDPGQAGGDSTGADNAVGGAAGQPGLAFKCQGKTLTRIGFSSSTVKGVIQA